MNLLLDIITIILLLSPPIEEVCETIFFFLHMGIYITQVWE